MARRQTGRQITASRLLCYPCVISSGLGNIGLANGRSDLPLAGPKQCRTTIVRQRHVVRRPEVANLHSTNWPVLVEGSCLPSSVKDEQPRSDIVRGLGLTGSLLDLLPHIGTATRDPRGIPPLLHICKYVRKLKS